MFIEQQFKKSSFLQLLLLLALAIALTSCTISQNETDIEFNQTTETPISAESSSSPLIPTVKVPVDSFPTLEPEEVMPTAEVESIEIMVITSPTLINLDIPLETENLPAYGWFSEDSQIVHFAYPKEGVSFSYNISTQELISTTLSQKSNEEIIEQITADLPADARVWEISPRYQNVLYTIPVSQPEMLERGAFSVPLSDELWLYKEGESFRLGTVDECFLTNLRSGALWSPSETFAIVNAFAAMACAWNNWLIDLETFSADPIDEIWKAGSSGFYVASILPNKQLLLTALLRNEPSAILDLQTQELTIFLNQGDEVVRYFDDNVFLDFLFWQSRNETEIMFSPVNEKAWQLINTIEGSVRVKYVSPDQKQVLLFSGSPNHYGLSENQKTSGVWLLSFP